MFLTGCPNQRQNWLGLNGHWRLYSDLLELTMVMMAVLLLFCCLIYPTLNILQWYYDKMLLGNLSFSFVCFILDIYSSGMNMKGFWFLWHINSNLPEVNINVSAYKFTASFTDIKLIYMDLSFSDIFFLHGPKGYTMSHF